MAKPKPLPQQIWLFEVTIETEAGPASALAVSVAQRRAAARILLERDLSPRGVVADLSPLGTLFEIELDEAAALTEGLGDGDTALGPFGYDSPQALGAVRPPDRAFALTDLRDVDALGPWLFAESEPAHGGPPEFLTSAYALLDASRLFGLPEMLAGSGLAHLSLFTGKAAVEYADSAPYLVRLRTAHGLTDRLLAAGRQDDPLSWDGAPGVFLRSPLSLKGLSRQLRGFTFVHDPARNTRSYLRFYDPGIFRAVFVNAEPEVQARFMRGIDCVAFAGPGGRPQVFHLPER